MLGLALSYLGIASPRALFHRWRSRMTVGGMGFLFTLFAHQRFENTKATSLAEMAFVIKTYVLLLPVHNHYFLACAGIAGAELQEINTSRKVSRADGFASLAFCDEMFIHNTTYLIYHLKLQSLRSR